MTFAYTGEIARLRDAIERACGALSEPRATNRERANAAGLILTAAAAETGVTDLMDVIEHDPMPNPDNRTTVDMSRDPFRNLAPDGWARFAHEPDGPFLARIAWEWKRRADALNDPDRCPGRKGHG